MQFSGIKIIKLLSVPAQADIVPNIFYLIENSTGETSLYLSNSKSQLIIICTETCIPRTRKYLTDYGCDLEAAITDIGTDEVELVVTELCTIPANVISPDNIVVAFEGEGGFFTEPDVVALIQNRRDWPYHRLFFGTGSVVLGKKPNLWIYQVWWSGLDSNGVDDTPALNELKKSLQINGAEDDITAIGADVGGGDSGGRVKLCDGSWKVIDFSFPSNSYWEGKANNTYASFGTSGTTWIPADGYEDGATISRIFQAAVNVNIRDLSYDVDVLPNVQSLKQHGYQGEGSQFNIHLDDVTFRAVGVNQPDQHVIKSEGDNTDWECVDNYYNHVTYVVGENGTGWSSNSANTTMFFMQPVGQLVGTQGTVLRSDGHGWLEVEMRDFRGPTDGDYDDVTEELDRTQEKVTVIFNTSNFAASVDDINTGGNIIKIKDFIPSVGEGVQFTTTGTLPGGISGATTYYITSYTPNDKLATFATDMVFGTPTLDITSLGSGTHTLTVVESKTIQITSGTFPHWSTDDLGQKITHVVFTDGNYITKLDSEIDARMYYATSSPLIEANVGVYRQSTSASIGYAGIVLNGNRGTTIIRNGAEEGLSYGLVCTATTAEYYNSITLDNAGIEGRIRFEGTAILRLVGTALFSLAIEQSGGLGPIIYADVLDVVKTTILRGPGNPDTGTRQLEEAYPYGSGSHFFIKPVETLITDIGNFSVRPTTRFQNNLTVFDLTPNGPNADNTFCGIESGTTQSQPGVEDKILFWLGVIDSVSLKKRFGYGFTRSGDTGFLNITGDQADSASRGVFIADRVISPQGKFNQIIVDTDDGHPENYFSVVRDTSSKRLMFTGSETGHAYSFDAPLSATYLTVPTGTGVSPEATLGGLELETVNSSNTLLMSNGYFDGTNFKYRNTGYFNVIQSLNAGWLFYTSPSGTAGGTATITQAFTLSQAGAGLFTSTLSASNLSGTNTGDQLTFKTISVSGQSDVVADSATDVLTLVAGTNVTLTTNATTDSITISSSAAGLADGNKGDITVSSSGATWTINNGAVTLAKMANLAANSIAGNNTGSAATPIALTEAQVRTFLGLNAATTNGVVYYDGTNYVTSANLKFDGTTQTIVSGSGAVPEARIGSVEVETISLNNALITNNGYYDGANFKYRATGYFNTIQYLNGGWQFITGPSGTAGATVSYATILTIANTTGNAVFTGTVAASNLSGTNTGDQTITLTSDVTGSGTGSFVTTISSGAVTLSKMANLAANKMIGNPAGSSATPSAMSPTDVKTFIGAIDLASTDVTGHLGGKRFLGKVEAAIRGLRGI